MSRALKQTNVSQATFGREPEFERLCNVVRRHDLPTLAKRAGVAPSTLYYWTEGVTQAPRLSTLCKVARAVGMRWKLVKK